MRSRARERTGSAGTASMRLRIELARDRRVLRGSPSAPRRTTGGPRAAAVEQRLLADPVAGQQQPPPPASQSANANIPCSRSTQALAELLVEVQRSPPCRSRSRTRGPATQVGAQLPVVVDLAVEDHDDRAVLVGDRLVSVFEIDHGQSLHTESHPGVEEVPRESGPRCLSARTSCGGAIPRASPRERAFRLSRTSVQS